MDIRTYLRLALVLVLFLLLDNSFALALPSKDLRILCLPFQNSTGSGDYDSLAESFGDVLMAAITKFEGAQVVERENLSKVIAEQKLGSLQGDSKRREIGRLLGANRIVSGGIVKSGKKLIVDAHVFDTETTQMLTAVRVTGSQDDILKLVDEVTRKLIAELLLGEKVATLPVSQQPQAELHFLRGLGKYFGHQYDLAVAEFMKALSFSPHTASARYFLGKSYFDGKRCNHAVVEFSRFLKDFPQDKRSVEVRGLIARCSQ